MSDIDQTIIDSSKPNAGRVYDYLLGGHYNYEVDRNAGNQLLTVAPYARNFAKLTRWFLHEAIRRAVDRGFTQFLDFASGVPAPDHIHNNTPTGTKVIYSDIDPITVQLGRKIIGNNSIVRYEICDASKPENILSSEIIKSFFGNNHKVAIGFNGICWFLNDQQISHAMKTLYEWADTGSILFFTDYDSENLSEEIRVIIDLYKNMNQYIGARTKKEFIELVKPWEVEEPGLLPFEKWYNLPLTVTEDAVKLFGGGGTFSGFLRK